ncbi:MAG: SAM-dependent methyltransferase, partial [Candidatus Ornithomonoglobus sp.]
MEINEIIKEITEQGVLKAVLSKPKKTAEYRKINISRSDKGYMSEAFTEKQAFHKALAGNELEGYLADTAGEYMQLNAWTNGVEHIVLISKKGHVTYKKKQSAECCIKPAAHNRKKQYLIEEGTIVPPLVDMGIFTSD